MSALRAQAFLPRRVCAGCAWRLQQIHILIGRDRLLRGIAAKSKSAVIDFPRSINEITRLLRLSYALCSGTSAISANRVDSTLSNRRITG